MRIKRNIAIVFTAGVLFSACSKQLDSQPTDAIAENNAFQTTADLQLGLNGAYGNFGTYLNNIYSNALLSDEGKLGANNAGQGALTYRYQFGSDGTTGGDLVGAYGGYYFMIDACNRTLSYVDGIAGDQATKNRIKAQLLALRGVGHFELLRMYGGNYNPGALGVAVVKVSNPLALPARNTMAETMSAIEQDFSDAAALFPATTSANFSDTVFNSINLTAYRARVALYKGDYQAAINYATTVISSGIKPLVNATSGTAFSGIWTDLNTNEVLFRYRYETSTALGGLFSTTQSDNNIYIGVSDKLAAAYGAGDARKSVYIGTNSAGNYVNKYYSSTRGGRVVHMKVFRTAELYLIRAEAYAKLSSPNLSAGSADLNTLRALRISGYTPTTYATASDLVTATLNERFLELAFEGSRFFDLRRNNLPVERNATDAASAWQTLPASSFRFVYPIPRDAINANPNIKQNTGY